MPKTKKDLGLKKIKPKKMKPKPGSLLYSIGSDLGSQAFKSIKKGFANKMTPYSILSLTVDELIKKISLEPEEFKSFLVNNKLFRNIDPDLESIMAYARSKNIIYNRFNTCYSSSISSKPPLLEKFMKRNRVSNNRIKHIQMIINSLVSNLSKDEVDRKSIDSDQKILVLCLLVQFKDPESKMMGISLHKKDDRFDFFKEWCTNIFPEINPDISIYSGSKSKKKSKKSKKKGGSKTRKRRIKFGGTDIRPQYSNQEILNSMRYINNNGLNPIQDITNNPSGHLPSEIVTDGAGDDPMDYLPENVGDVDMDDPRLLAELRELEREIEAEEEGEIRII
jgi:hypothetical protein